MANSDPVGALMRGIDILKLIGTSENGMRVCEIASALGLKQPTCYNLVRTLLYTGFLEKRNSRLFLGQELIKLLEKHDQKEIASMMEPELLSLYQRLSRVTVIRGKLCFRHAFDTGGIWFTDEDLQPIVNEYEEYKSLTEKDRAFLIENWKRDAYESALARCIAHYDKAVEETAHAIRLPENILRVYPPKKYLLP